VNRSRRRIFLRRRSGKHQKAGKLSRFSRNGFVEWPRLMSKARRHFAPAPAQADGVPRMNCISSDQISPPPGRVKIAAVLAAGAIALLALDAGLELRPALAPTQIAVSRAFAPPEKAQEKAKETSAVRSFAYYPEQLAALTSLSNFTPGPESRVADPLADPSADSAHPSASAIDPRPARRAETLAKPSSPPAGRAPASFAATIAPLAATVAPLAATVASESATDRSVRLFGVAIPGAAEIGGRIAALRENASNWSESAWSLGGKIGGIWR
jgi:hypothetical protein